MESELTIENDARNKPIIEAVSKDELTVVAGDGLGGGIRVYRPQPMFPRTISLNPEKDGGALGIIFSYQQVARIFLKNTIVWTNHQLPDAPSGRQDVFGTNLLTLDLFDSEQLREIITENRQALQKLGLDFPQLP